MIAENCVGNMIAAAIPEPAPQFFRDSNHDIHKLPSLADITSIKVGRRISLFRRRYMFTVEVNLRSGRNWIHMMYGRSDAVRLREMLAEKLKLEFPNDKD